MSGAAMLSRLFNRKRQRAWRRSMNALATFFRNRTRHTRLLARVGFPEWLARGAVAVRAIGPYAAIELILPGGTLLAFLLWLYRQHQRGEPLRPLIARSLSRLRFGVRRAIETVSGL